MERTPVVLSGLIMMAVICVLGNCKAEADTIVILPEGDPLILSVATDKVAYVSGELLMVSVTAHNPNDFDANLFFSSSLQAQYTMDEAYTWPNGGFAMFTDVSIPANSSHTWSFPHYWSQYDLTLGTHGVVGTVLGVGSSQPYSFDVIAPTLPTSDVLIDFEYLPDGRALPVMGNFDDEYAAWGVHFGEIQSDGIDDIAVHAEDDNQFAYVGSTGYPPGFNIIAEFDMPVYGVSADVTSSVGTTITMVVKDSNGQIIDSVISDAVPALREFVGTIELHSQTPIASVEWWPSAQNASVMVDNIYLTIPEPATLSLLAFGGLALIRRKNLGVNGAGG